MEQVMPYLESIFPLVSTRDSELAGFLKQLRMKPHSLAGSLRTRECDHALMILLTYISLGRSEVPVTFAVSWIITWFSHDIDDFEKICRLFDVFLASGPFMPIYMAAAVM